MEHFVVEVVSLKNIRYPVIGNCALRLKVSLLLSSSCSQIRVNSLAVEIVTAKMSSNVISTPLDHLGTL